MDVNLLELSKLAILQAQKLGALEAEIYMVRSRGSSIEVENSNVKSAFHKEELACVIRSALGKQLGCSYVSTVATEDVLEAVAQSVKLAKVNIPDDHFMGLPSIQGRYSEPSGIYDPNLERLTSEEALDLAMRMVTAAKDFDARISAVMAKFETLTEEVVVANTSGIEGETKTTALNITIGPTAKDGDQRSALYDLQSKRNLKNFEPEEIGENIGRRTINALASKTIKGGDMPVVIDPNALLVLFGPLGLGGAVNAFEVQNERSFLADALEKDVAPEIVTITDDSLISNGVGSRPFDAEGYPSQTTAIIQQGILKSYLHNSYTSNKGKTANTGNASRSKGVWPYSEINVSPSNLIMKAGSKTQEDLITDIPKGVFLKGTGDVPNLVTGDLSAMVVEGYLIQNGTLEHALKNTMVGINMKDLLSRISEVGGDVSHHAYPGRKYSVISPSIIIESAKITSS
ncbi:MAG: TldD/PmbA family protein [Candidatus Hodarchaeales archaeon]|jgi:PmbA protein